MPNSVNAAPLCWIKEVRNLGRWSGDIQDPVESQSHTVTGLNAQVTIQLLWTDLDKVDETVLIVL